MTALNFAELEHFYCGKCENNLGIYLEQYHDTVLWTTFFTELAYSLKLRLYLKNDCFISKHMFLQL